MRKILASMLMIACLAALTACTPTSTDNPEDDKNQEQTKPDAPATNPDDKKDEDTKDPVTSDDDKKDDADTKPQEPAKPDTKPQEPAKPDTKPQEPAKPDTKPQEPAKPDTKPQEPAKPDTKPQEPAKPDTKPEAPAGGVTSSSSLNDIMDFLYKDIETPSLERTAITADNSKFYFGLDLTFAEGLASEPMMTSQAHSLCLIKVDNSADIAQIKKDIAANVDPRKWICVEVDAKNVRVESVGNLVLLVMDDTNGHAIADKFLTIK